MDVYEVPVASRSIYLRTSKGEYRVKFLFVMTPSGEVIHVSGHPGCLDNQAILERSTFGMALRDRGNPMNLPLRLRMRNSAEYATPCVLADCDWPAGGTPFLLVSPMSNAYNYCRLTIERFFGRFANIFRFLLSYVAVENGHNLCDMVYTAVALYNYRLLMDDDPSHVHTIVCSHFLQYFYDEERVVREGPVLDPSDNREQIMRCNGIPHNPRHGMPRYPEPAEANVAYGEEELQAVMQEMFEIMLGDRMEVDL